MAADTPGKRFSLLSMGRPWVRTLPQPDGTLSTADRLELVLRYGAILMPSGIVIGNARATGAARVRPQATMVADE